MSAYWWNIALGLFFATFSCVCLIWWIPNDIETGLIEQDRYSVNIGDSLLPTVTALAILGLSGLLALQSFLQMRKEPQEDGALPQDKSSLTAQNAVNLMVMALILLSAVVIMVWAGPLVIEMLNAFGLAEKSYRQLSDTVPYKYIGFALGGFLMIFGLIAWVQGQITWRAAGVALGMVIFLIVLYDVPFDSLLLPPNGSV